MGGLLLPLPLLQYHLACHRRRWPTLRLPMPSPPTPAPCPPPPPVQVSGVITFLRTENICYPACPLIANGRTCNKKLLDNGDGTWCALRCVAAVACGAAHTPALHCTALRCVGLLLTLAVLWASEPSAILA